MPDGWAEQALGLTLGAVYWLLGLARGVEQVLGPELALGLALGLGQGLVPELTQPAGLGVSEGPLSDGVAHACIAALTPCLCLLRSSLPVTVLCAVHQQRWVQPRPLLVSLCRPLKIPG